MTATTTRRPRALLLDDDPVVLRLLGTALEARGFDVRAAADGASGLELLLDELLELDVLVMDAELPGRDAASLVRLVRHAGGERDLGVVILAGAGARAAREHLLALGADAVVERARGHAAAANAVAAVAARCSTRAREWLETARPALHEALAAARRTPAPAPRFATAA